MSVHPVEGIPMKHFTALLLIFALLMAATPSHAAPSFAGRGLAAPAAAAPAPIADPVQDRWWGGAAAIGCGFGARFWPAFGWNLGYNALLAVACATMLIDAMG
jgi:opacity protein-like surface antigen